MLGRCLCTRISAEPQHKAHTAHVSILAEVAESHIHLEHEFGADGKEFFAQPQQPTRLLDQAFGERVVGNKISPSIRKHRDDLRIAAPDHLLKRNCFSIRAVAKKQFDHFTPPPPNSRAQRPCIRRRSIAQENLQKAVKSFFNGNAHRPVSMMKNRRLNWFACSAPVLDGEELSDPAEAAKFSNRIIGWEGLLHVPSNSCRPGCVVNHDELSDARSSSASIASYTFNNHRRGKRQRHTLSIYGVNCLDIAAPPTVLGIDPGASGGIACWRHNEPTQACAMPETEGDQIDLIQELIGGGEAIAFVEQVGGFTGKGQPGSAMFKFGRSFRFTLGVLQTLGVRVELVQPQKWQKPLALATASSCATRSEWKSKLRTCAQGLQPKLKPTLSTADAILILEFGLKSLRLGAATQ
jgi:hypothetical protein